jgi:acetylornithine/succinyldiaminopimelate/putrescine aminotransferase
MGEILSKGFLKSVQERGNHLRSRLEELARGHEVVSEVRGLGLMQAIDLKVPAAEFATAMREAGVLVNCTAETVLRFLPPLIVTNQEIDEVAAALDMVLSRAKGG